MRKPWLQCNSDYWFEQRMRVLVRDNFQCQWERIHKFIPDEKLYYPETYERQVARWEGVTLIPIEGLCFHNHPEMRLRLLHVHHIIERIYFHVYQTEGHDLSNLITLCRAHHEQIHPHMKFDRPVTLKEL